MQHGRVPGRDFELRMEREGRHIGVGVSDARGKCRPLPSREPDEGGYGLLLIATLATVWGVGDQPVGKTVWGPYLPVGIRRRG
ncbi:ATP-binding protein [Streptomyces sp. NPDC012450]|uniref:ATP-binding protein n=1 Tax=Streptomyces sp. NPDC012450 TaxID=3364834 RepID=UPI0036EDB771